MPDFTADIEIDVEEFWENCSRSEKNEMINMLEDEGWVRRVIPDGKNPGAVVDAFKHYPVPTWTGSSWDYGTEYAKKAARRPLGSFNR